MKGIIVIDTLLEKPVMNLVTIIVLSVFRIGLIMNSNGDAEDVCCRFHGKICKSEVMLFQLNNLELPENQTVDSTTKIHIYYIF